jgi:hypothetical protein
MNPFEVSENMNKFENIENKILQNFKSLSVGQNLIKTGNYGEFEVKKEVER